MNYSFLFNHFYGSDNRFELFLQSFKRRCATPTFQVSPNGVQMKAKVSPSFYKRLQSGGYTYVCLPWIDKNQWHAFSLYEYPGETDTACVFMDSAGDWTSSVHKALQRRTSRPVWFCGPFPSPYNNADLYDNQILIASGIGITPALSALHSLRNSRRINVIWMVRDPHMLDFFTKLMKPDDEGWILIFYTGKEPISNKYEKLNTNVRIIKKRPDLEMMVTNLIYGIESGYGLPEKAVKNSEKNMLEALTDKIRDLDETGMTTSMKMVELSQYAKHYGFELNPLMNELNQSIRQSSSRKESMQELVLQDIERHILHNFDSMGDSDGDDTDSDPKVYNIYDNNYSEFQKNDCDGGTDTDGDASNRKSKVFNIYDSNYSELHDEDGKDDDNVIPVFKNTHFDEENLISDEEMGVINSNVSNFHISRLTKDDSLKLIISDDSPDVDERRQKRRASFTLMRNSSALMADPSQNHGNVPKQYVKRLLGTPEGKDIIASWGLLYCGGNEHIRKNLKQISRDYRLDLNTECFRW